MTVLQPKNDDQSRRTSGGAAAAGGFQYQAEVTAWWAACILLQTQEVGCDFALPNTAIAVRLSCETGDYIDDIRIELSDGSIIFGQCKRSVQRSKRRDSEFGKVIQQFIKENSKSLAAPIERRFVLFYEKHNGSLDRLRKILDLYRCSPSETVLDGASISQEDQEIVSDLNDLLNMLSVQPNRNSANGQRESLLRSSCIKQLEVSEGATGYLNIVDSLQSVLLIKPEQIILVMKSLQELGHELIVNHGSVDRASLRTRLQAAGVDLKDSVNFRSDFTKLDAWSRDRIAAEEAQGGDRLSREIQLTITRPVVKVMLQTVMQDSFLVVGEAGAGKTGCLLALARQLNVAGRRVWYCAANPANSSLQQIHNEALLEHAWEEILADAASGIQSVMIVDGLDGLRDAPASKAYQDLMALALKRGLKVVASIRTFDLLHSLELRQLFKGVDGPLSETFKDTTLRPVKHFAVSGLDEGELAQVEDALPEMRDYFTKSPTLRNICRNVFFLHLLCELCEIESHEFQLTEISSQEQLFDRWWERKILGHKYQEECLSTLRSIVKTMVEQRSLSVMFDQWTTEVKRHLFSAGILISPQVGHRDSTGQHRVEFRHHRIFDYFAMKLFISHRRDDLSVELTGTTNWGLFLRPSLTLFFLNAWNENREEFWELLARLENSSVMFFYKVPAYLVVVSEAASLNDLRPLLDAERWPNQAHLVQQMVATARYHSLPRLFNRGEGDCWLELALQLIGTSETRLIRAGRVILQCAGDNTSALSASGKAFLNRGSQQLVRHYWRIPGLLRDAAGPIMWICRTISADIDSAVRTIHEILSQEQLQSVGYIQVPSLANEIKKIWEFDPSLAIEVYEAIFSFRDLEGSCTDLGDGAILRLRSTRKDQYQMGRYVLRSKFQEFLQAHPARATTALCRVIRSAVETPQVLPARLSTEIFDWNERPCRITQDGVEIWFEIPMPQDDEEKMLIIWEERLEVLPLEESADKLWDSIELVLITENESARVWRSLLKAASKQPEFFADRLAPLLISPIILFGPGTRTMALNCLRKFSSSLESQILEEIQSIVLETMECPFVGTDTPLSSASLQERRARVLCAIPREYRTERTQEFLSTYDPDLIAMFEEREWDSDRVTGSTSDGTCRVIHAGPSKEAETPDPETEFLESLKPDDITEANVADILGRILAINQSLESSHEKKRHKGVPMEHWCLLALAAVASSPVAVEASISDHLFRIFENELLVPCEIPSHEALESFDTRPHWGIPDPLVLSAQGFLSIVARGDSLNDASRNLLNIIARHPYPRVRFQLVGAFHNLIVRCPELVFEIVEQWVQHAQEGPGTLALVSKTLFGETLLQLRNLDKERTDRLIDQFCDAAHMRGSQDLRRNCGRLIGEFYIDRGEKWAWQRISLGAVSIQDWLPELSGIVSEAAETYLNPVSNAYPANTSQRALAVLRLCLEKSHQVIEEYFQSIGNNEQLHAGAGHPPWVKEASDLGTHVGSHFNYWAEEASKGLIPGMQEREASGAGTWFGRVESILEILIQQPYAPVAFLMIRGLKNLVVLAPSQVLKWLARITEASEAFGITLESSAMDETIEILETLIADQQLDLKEEGVISSIVQITERYLRSGWPRAFEFATQLEGIFR